MMNKLFVLLLFTVSCGPDVKLKHNRLEDVSPLTDEQLKKFEKNGTLIKGNPDKVIHNGRPYTVSIYCSKVALDFLKTIPAGSQVEIIFTGGFDRKNFIVLETVRKK